jgi:hypothetical protein
MTRVEALLEQAKRLSPNERKELAKRLQASLKSHRVQRERKPLGPYSPLLELAGTADSEFHDVSTNKHKHLAEIYAPRRS